MLSSIGPLQAFFRLHNLDNTYVSYFVVLIPQPHPSTDVSPSTIAFSVIGSRSEKPRQIYYIFLRPGPLVNQILYTYIQRMGFGIGRRSIEEENELILKLS